jgi:carbamoyltransferase
MLSKLPTIPKNSILGINYSGMHDSAIVIISPNGEIIFASSLERLSRVKQDGRPPYVLLDIVPWEKISKIAVSTEFQFRKPDKSTSCLLEVGLAKTRSQGLMHLKEFYDFFDSLPCDKEYVCHQVAHAASAFWGSGFEDSLCLTYDGGMNNSPWFGGLYQARRDTKKILPLDRFSALHYAKITTLYTFVTALLGFTPNKHEGKITGLAARGIPTKACHKLLDQWFKKDYLSIESTMEWVFSYAKDINPILLVNKEKLEIFQSASRKFSKEELAATVQEYTEQHILSLLSKAKNKGFISKNICLAGGLFANVKINQKIVELGFEKIYIAPPMADDGTALGAAWYVASQNANFNPKKQNTMYLGLKGYNESTIEKYLRSKKIKYSTLSDPVKDIATLLSDGSVVGIYRGLSEFGPRALGNRSILSNANNSQINETLNNRLQRTEFMPFAPIVRMVDADSCFYKVDQIKHAAEFMTITADCKKIMKTLCPAVVHIDGTARPQLLRKTTNPFVYEILSEYKKNTGRPALINTSFNVHEEPIVCTIDDAVKGLFLSGIDYLLIGDKTLISYKDNQDSALLVSKKYILNNKKSTNSNDINKYLSRKIFTQEKQLVAKEETIEQQAVAQEQLTKQQIQANKQFEQLEASFQKQLVAKEETIQQQAVAQEQLTKQQIQANKQLKDAVFEVYEPLIDGSLLLQLESKEKVIQEQKSALDKFYKIKFKQRFKQTLKRLFGVRLGELYQYSPRHKVHINDYKIRQIKLQESSYPKVSIVTPSFNQGEFIERTINSVLNQSYQNIEYCIQDGGSTDNTVEIIKKYDKKIFQWKSEKDSGQSQAINRGFGNTSGEIMAWLNSDDILFPGAVSAIVEYFQTHPEIDVVYGDRLNIDENDMEIGRWILPKKHDNDVLSYADYIPQETMFWRRSIWEKSGSKIDESFRFAMDWDLIVRFRDSGANFSHIQRLIGGFRIHSQQKTSAQIEEVGVKEMNKIRERCLGYIPTGHENLKNIKQFMFLHILCDLKFRIKSLSRRKK